MAEEKKKKKKDIEYDIDPSLPEEEQRRLRKQIRADRRKERDDRRKRRDGGAGGPEDSISPPHSARSETPTKRESARVTVTDAEESLPKKGSAAWEWTQKQKEEEDKKRAAATAEADVSATAKSAMAAAREKERQHLEETRRLEEQRRRETDEEALKERRRQDKAARERRAEEERARAEEDAARRRRDEATRKQQEADRRERERREAERAAERARERQEFEARREAQLRQYREENERAARELVLQMSAREREELAAAEEERAAAAARRERTKQAWAERLREAEQRVRRQYAEVLERVQRSEQAASARKAAFAGTETDEWLLNAMPAKSFAALGGLRELGTQVQARPTALVWVVVGAKSRAKANVLDALLGMPLFKGVDVLRTFCVHLRHDAEAELSPEAVFEDAPLRRHDTFRLPQEMADRNAAEQAAPCVLTLRYKFFWDVTFVVTPDLPEPILPSVYDPQRWPLVMQQLAPPERMLLWVDRCDAEPPLGAQFAKMLEAADPRRSRSLLVLNGLSEVLSELTLTPEVNAFLGQEVPVPVFFVSFSAEKNSPADLKARMQADSAALKRLKSFGEYDERVGMQRLGLRVQSVTHEMYLRSVAPQLLSRIHRLEAELAAEQRRVAALVAGLEPEQLRGVASRFLAQYLLHFGAALQGSGGDPAVNGETLQEERASAGLPGDRWTVNPRLAVAVPAAEVPHSDAKLLGRGAFARLLAEMGAAVAKAPLAPSPAADAALLANCGPARSGLEPDFAFAASDVASKRAREVLRPLLAAAVQRAAHIARRLAAAAEAAAAAERRRGGGSDAAAMAHAPFFFALVREAVHEFVEEHAARCARALDDEFRATAFLPLALLRQARPATREEEEELARVGVMASGVLEELRGRLLEGARLALLEHLLEPLGEPLQRHVAARLAAVRPEQLEAALEPEAARARLLEEQCRLQQEATLVAEYHRIFQMHIGDF